MAVESSGLGDLRSNNENDLDMTSKLAKLNDLFPKDHGEAEDGSTDNEPLLISPSDNSRDEDLGPLPPPVAPPSMEAEDIALFNPASATQQLKSNGGTPMFPKLPSYSDLFLDTLRTPSSNHLSVLPPSSPSVFSLSHSQHELSKQPKSRTPARVLQKQYSRALDSLNISKHIEFIRLATYQGRLALSSPKYDSTNGCAVISPLVVATHICPQHNNRSNNDQILSHKVYGITNTAINEIIDKRSPPVLRAIRSKLGLNHHALIIPSDVHDYLVDEKILPQEKFVGVCGGNILDEDHTKELIDMLVNGVDGNAKNNSGDQKNATEKKDNRIQKVGAALFFREHVISILKIPLGNGACYFDLIDSLPTRKTGGMACRTRCKDRSSFETMLGWYACSKFTEGQCDFIDSNQWNDGMCDFDPRVFQGFVWAE